MSFHKYFIKWRTRTDSEDGLGKYLEVTVDRKITEKLLIK